MTTAHSNTTAAGSGLHPDLFDAVAFEARLAAARLRRQAVVAEQASAARDARPPALVIDAAGSPRLARPRWPWIAGAAAAGGLAVLLLSAGAREPAAVPAADAAANAAVDPVVPAPVFVALLPVVPAKVSAPLPAFPSVAAPTGPVPRPADLRVPRPTQAAVRSARNAPRDPVTPPEAVGLIVRDLNAATIGRVAGALGIRGRKDVPGVPVSVRVDRRGLGFDGRPQAKSR